MPLSTGGKASRRKRRKRLKHVGETIEESVLSEVDINDQVVSSKPIAKRRRRWSAVYAIFAALFIAPAYRLFWIIWGSDGNWGRGAPHFFMFVINFPLCVLWVFYDRKDDPGADEPLSPKVREAMRKGERVSKQEKLGSPNMWRN